MTLDGVVPDVQNHHYRNTIMQPQEYYPPISSLIDVGKLPSQLGFIKDSLESLFHTTFFRDLQYTRSAGGGRAFYSMSLLRYGHFSIFIPGTEIEIRFNSAGNALHTEIPITVQYDWRILDLIGGFSLDTFSSDLSALYNVFIREMGPDPILILRQALDNALEPTGSTISSFVLEASDTLGIPLSVPATGDLESQLRQIIGSIEEELHIPALEAIYLIYLASSETPEDALRRFEQLFSMLLGGRSVSEYLEDLLIPRVEASLRVAPSVVFPRSILLPVDSGDKPTEGNVTMSFGEADFYFSTVGGIGFDTSTALSLTRAMIGNTGLIVEFKDLKLDLSTTASIPEAAADGRGPDFMGAYIGKAKIGLPDFWKAEHEDPDNDETWAEILADNVLIGTGGLSGTLGLKTTDEEPVLKTTFGAVASSPSDPGSTGFTIELTRFDIRFHQGAIVSSDIRGKLQIPGFYKEGSTTERQVIDVQITIDERGFKIGGTFEGLTIEIPQILKFTLRSLYVGRQDSGFFLETSGSLDIIAEIPVVGERFITKPVEVQKLIIWSNGQFDLEGGSLVLPDISPLKVGPVELSVTALHFGRESQAYNGVQRQYKYIGFDGGIKTGMGGVDARGEGVKFYFTVDGLDLHTFLHIETIRIDLRIPGEAPPESAALLLKGYVSMKNPTSNAPGHPTQTEYAGGVTFRLPQLELGGGAELRMIPATGAFLMDAHLELSTPILLGSTGLGIYGFRGTIGNNYVLDKPVGQEWWEFYKSPVQGINLDKFSPGKGFSAGAGASIATAFDSGATFSSKLFFMLSLPKVFMMEGQAALLSKRVGLDTTDDPPFYAVLTIDPEGVQAIFGANLDIPEDSGYILTLDAMLEMAFFFGRSSAWHIYIGRDQPDSKRIQATILKILHGWAYFMISSKGIKAGAGVDWKFEQDCGIAKVGLGASLEVGGEVSFKPVQLGGWIILQGYAELKVFGIGFRLTVKADLRGEAPNPFIIAGSFKLSLSTPWPLPNVDIRVSLSWHFVDPGPAREIKLLAPPSVIANDPLRCPELQQSVKAVNMLTGDPFPLNFVNDDYSPANTALREHPAPAVPRPVIPSPSATGAWFGEFSRFTVPMDSFIDIEFTKGMRPGAADPSMEKIAPLQDASVNSEVIPPQKGESPQVKYTYKVESLRIYYWSDLRSEWRPYDVLSASTPILDMVAQSHSQYATNHEYALEWARTTQIGTKMKYGFWQLSEAQRYTKLRLLARTSYSQNPEVNHTELGFPPMVLVCPPDKIEMTCLNWTDIPDGTPYAANTTLFDRKLRFRITSQDAKVVPYGNPFNLPHSLRLLKDNKIELYFPEPVTQVRLKLSTLSSKVVISYYLGYPYTPAPVATSPTGGKIDRWDVSQVVPSGGSLPDDMWDKLRAMPSFVRALCSGTSVDMNLAPIKAIDAIMTNKFKKTNLYLRQLWGLNAPNLTAGFCDRLREMLEVIGVGLTGRNAIPVAVRKNVEYFYLDVKRYAEQYVQQRLEAGLPIPEPPAAANEFYEKWLDLLACLGKTYDKRGALTVPVQGMLSGLIDPEIGRLYKKVKMEAADRSMKLNQNDPLSDPLLRLRMIAEFFSIVSLTLSTATIPSTLIDEMDPYYEKLSGLVGMLRVLLDAQGFSGCANTGGSVIPSGEGSRISIDDADGGCSRIRDLQSITRLMCAATAGPLADPSVTAITLLLAGFNNTVGELESYFGWSASSGTGVFCSDLKRALRVLVVAFSVFNELPSDLRFRVRDFYGKLQKLVADYREATQDAELPEPTEAIDLFVSDWTNVLACLCRLCGEVENFADAGERTYFNDSLTTMIDGLYDAVAPLVSTAGTPLQGATIPADDCDLVQTAIGFLASLSMNCDDATPAMLAWLDTKLTALQGAYDNVGSNPVGFKQGAVAPYHGVLCGTTPMHSTCPDWLDALQVLDILIARRAYLPQSIITRIETDFDQLLLDISNAVFSVYQDLLFWPAFDTTIENTEFEVRYILGHVYEDCLRGNAVAPSIYTWLQNNELNTLQTRFTELQQALDGLPENERIAPLVLSVSPCAWQKDLLNAWRKLCNTPPTAEQLAAPPFSEIVTLMHDAQEMFDELSATLNLDPVPAGWTNTEFCATLERVVGILVIGYGATMRLPLSLESRMGEFCNALKTKANAYIGGSTAPLAGCQTTCDSMLAILYCLCNVCRYKEYLPSGVFTGNSSLHGALGTHLTDLAKKSLLWSDELRLESGANRRPANRCRTIRMIANYFGINVLSYTDAAAVKTLFDQHAALLGALETGLPNALAKYCPVPVDSAYDPLRKRERIEAADLGTPVEYDHADQPIDRIVIAPAAGCSGGCETYIHEICWISQFDHEYNNDLPDPLVVAQTSEDTIKALNLVTQPIWRPNTKYAVQIETTEQINGDEQRPFRSFYTFGFQTAGPVGHFHATGPETSPVYNCGYSALLSADAEAGYQYAKLKQYIDYERSYPDANGNIIGAKPLYFKQSQLQIFYRKEYMNSMYGLWNAYEDLPEVRAGVQIVIRDTAREADPAWDIKIDPIWRKDEKPPQPRDYEIFRYMVKNSGDCLQFDPVPELAKRPPARKTVIPLGVDLQPRKLYTAIFNALLAEGAQEHAYGREVHKYVFQTSRYPDFETHIGSYNLGEGEEAKKAIHTITVDAADADMAKGIIDGVAPGGTGQADRYKALNVQYADLLDRIVDGALWLGTLEAPATTEFIIVTTGSGAQARILGVLLRSPEPFNDPKLPVDQLKLGLQATGFGSGALIYFSKDAARVFVTNSALDLLSGQGTQQLGFQFQYRLFDGADYTAVKVWRNNGTEQEPVWEETPAAPVTVTFTVPYS